MRRVFCWPLTPDPWPLNAGRDSEGEHELWQTKRKHQSNKRRRATGRPERKAEDRAEIVRDLVGVADAVPADLRAKAEGAGANFSGAKRFASSASRKSKTSTTRT